MDIIAELVKNWSYLGVFVIVFGINVVPALMPPSWMVLSSFYLLDPSLSPFLLAVIGATASTMGRFVLTYVGSASRRFMSKERKTSLDSLRNFLTGKKYAFFSLSFIYALGPMPSNSLFIAYGLMKGRVIGMFSGFWLGRMISYFLLVYEAPVMFKSFLSLFSNHFYGVLVDISGVLSMIVFASINWDILITKRKIEFIRPKFFM